MMNTCPSDHLLSESYVIPRGWLVVIVQYIDKVSLAITVREPSTADFLPAMPLHNSALRPKNKPPNLSRNHCTASTCIVANRYRNRYKTEYEIEMILSVRHHLAYVRRVVTLLIIIKRHSFNLYLTKGTQAYSPAPRFWREISLFLPILPTFRLRRIWSLRMHSLGKFYLGGYLQSSIPGFPLSISDDGLV